MKINKNIIKELNDYLNEFNLTEIEYTEKDIKVKVSKSKVSKSIETLPSVNEKKIIKEEVSIDNSKKITSPIIGTAYLAPEPGGKKFIEIGQKIKKGDTVMIVEAMKTMNHVPSPLDGVIKEEVLIDNSKKITSPIIGTAYLAPEPGGKKFIEIGQKIKKGDTVMIVEAMKTMNHVPSPLDGVVKEISVEDGQPVEFGQTIATID